MSDASDAKKSVGPPKPARPSAVMPPPADADLWTFGETAYVLRVSVASVRRLVDGGHLATRQVTVGGKRLIARDDVQAYLRGSRSVATPAAPGTAEERRERAARDGRAMRTAATADWNTGEDLLGLDRPGSGRPRKARPH